MMKILIGVDDTDNLESRATGHCIRQMAKAIDESGLAQAEGITRHQLLVSPEIPYTSHNSSACLVAECEGSKVQSLWDFCSDFLQRESASGSDAGLCLAAWDTVHKEVRAFAQRAKREVLTQTELEVVAGRANLRLAGLTGTGIGMIGALAAVGLRVSGNDGRFLWLPGLRELNDSVYTVEQLQGLAHIDAVSTVEGIMLSLEQHVNVGNWVRPILRDGKAILLVKENKDEWRILDKENIKSQSQ